MDKLGDCLSKYIIKGTQLDYDTIRYGVDAILSTMLCFATAIITCTWMGNAFFAIFFIIFLTPIKSQFKSYHCSTMFKCIITYSIYTAIHLGIYNFLSMNSIIIPFLYGLISLVFIYILCVQEMTKKKCRYLIVYALLSILIFYINNNMYHILFLAMNFEVFLILMDKITRKGNDKK